MRRTTLLLLLLLIGSGCAFYEKRFVSEIVLEGRNRRPKVYDDGAFYVNAEPTVRMRLGCYASTTMVATMFPVIPIPFGRETPRHESISDEKFSLELTHYRSDGLDFSQLPVRLEIGGKVHPLRVVRKEQERYESKWEYEFEADLPCGDVEAGRLTIELDSGTVRTYGVQFEEGVQREVAWHPTFVT